MHRNDVLVQQPADEPRHSTSDAGTLMDLESSPSAPTGTGGSGFPDVGPAATGGAPGMPSASAGVYKIQSQEWHCNPDVDQLDICMSLDNDSGLCLKSVNFALLLLSARSPCKQPYCCFNGLSDALRLLPALLMQLLFKPSLLDGRHLRSPRHVQAQQLLRPQYHPCQTTSPLLCPSMRARLKHSQGGRPLMPRHRRHLRRLHLLRQPLKPM